MRLLACSLALALVATAPLASAQGSKQETQAVERFTNGKKLLDQKKAEEALVEFRASNDLLESPNTLFMIGEALSQLGRTAEAMQAYEDAAAKAQARISAGESRFGTTREEATRATRELRPKVFKLSVVVSGAPPETVVAVGGKSSSTRAEGDKLASTSWQVPGSLVVEVTAPGRPPVTQKLEATAGGEATVEIVVPAVGDKPPPKDEPPPPPPKEAEEEGIKPPPIVSWVLGGVGVVGLATFGAFIGLSESTWSDLQECSPNCGEDRRADADRAATFQIAGYVALGVGAASLIAAGVLWIALPREKDDPAAASVAVRVGPTGGVVDVRF